LVKQFIDKIEHARIGGWNYLTLTKQCEVGVQHQ